VIPGDRTVADPIVRRMNESRRSEIGQLALTTFGRHDPQVRSVGSRS
jgi:hypothetical protein